MIKKHTVEKARAGICRARHHAKIKLAHSSTKYNPLSFVRKLSAADPSLRTVFDNAYAAGVAVASKAIEIERSRSISKLEKAALWRKQSRKQHRVLQVPQNNKGKAARAMRNAGITGTVKNMVGTKRRSVR